jgi:hypothetical protein
MDKIKKSFKTLKWFKSFKTEGALTFIFPRGAGEESGGENSALE